MFPSLFTSSVPTLTAPTFSVEEDSGSVVVTVNNVILKSFFPVTYELFRGGVSVDSGTVTTGTGGATQSFSINPIVLSSYAQGESYYMTLTSLDTIVTSSTVVSSYVPVSLPLPTVTITSWSAVYAGGGFDWEVKYTGPTTLTYFEEEIEVTIDYRVTTGGTYPNDPDVVTYSWPLSGAEVIKTGSVSGVASGPPAKSAQVSIVVKAAGYTGAAVTAEIGIF